MSGVRYIYLFFYKVVELVGGGSVTKGAYPVLFLGSIKKNNNSPESSAPSLGNVVSSVSRQEDDVTITDLASGQSWQMSQTRRPLVTTVQKASLADQVF